MKSRTLQTVLTTDHIGQRLDIALAQLFPDFSRAFLQNAIKQGLIRVNQRTVRPRDLVVGGEEIVFTVLPPATAVMDEPRGEALDLSVCYADEDVIVIDKTAGIVVHPAAGHHSGTLVNALVHRYPELRQLPRAGIIHRLDKETSGLLVVARRQSAHKQLIEQMQAREISREYLCLVHGRVIAGGSVDAPIGRHPRHRKHRAVVAGGRPARTHYKVVARFKSVSLLRVCLETGRTHQIRVHMQHLQHPVFGDPMYGRQRLPKGVEKDSPAFRFRRQALHACYLSLVHPTKKERCEWHSALPQDMQALLDFFGSQPA